MQEQLISFETAKLAKEKGFRITSNDLHADELFYHHTGEVYNNFYSSGSRTALAPTQSLLQRWLREVHKIWIEVTFDPLVHYYYLQIVRWNEFPKSILKHKGQAEFDSYEQALEAGLIEALKLIKNENSL